MVVNIQSAPQEPVPAVMDLTVADSARYSIRIERCTAAPTNVLDTLDVTIESFGHRFAACQLKFGTNSQAVDIIAVLKGEIIDSCKWEYFRAERIDTRGKSNAPRTLWSVTALSQFMPDSVKPVCLGFDRSGTIVRLVVAGAPNVTIRDSVAPIFFWWEDCRDNTVSDTTGNLLYVSSQVQDSLDSGRMDTTRAFPTRLGTPDQCIKARLANHPQRRIEFRNGGLRFEAKLPPLKDSVETSTETR
ncbi:MAG: hypothetical protein HY851_07260 [candidate division Zixibacteria bacterium]|nr:hypothetical protein [candidate division Zixibacteria bacterium]